jgi:hypothetical protein
MSGFDCPMFDPQISRRYDAEGGTALGEIPNFIRPRTGINAARWAEQAAALEQLRQQVLARIEDKTKRTAQ